MCGVVGFVDSPWADQIEAALEVIATRGPDGVAVYRGPGIALGHRRLAVIDLVTGNQPMASPDGRHAIVFNGEIYNFRELRMELEDAGHSFRTQSDTEVLLAGYATWGAKVLPRLDGMFAFAIWDTRTRRLFAARDRVGVKPFFYSSLQGFAFASTLAPFLALAGFPRRLDLEALRDYLAFQTVLAPCSFLRDVRQLQPAHWLEYDASRATLKLEPYWTIPVAGATKADPASQVERINTALSSSVRRQLVADVPLGAFLSGGIDSSLMVHYMAHAGARPLRTFSVRFAESGFDETPYARAVAQRFATEHHEFDAPDLGADTFASALEALDQPLGDPAYVPTWALSRLTRSLVTVAISGDGGDELFGGYPRFREQAQDFPMRWWQPPLRYLIETGVVPEALLRRSLWGGDLLLYRRVELGPYAVSRKSLRTYLSPEAWKACRPEDTLRTWRNLASPYDTGSLMRADLWTYLSENCLVKTDRASMACGLEVRVPMLGNEVLDAALELPASSHFDPVGKALLRRLSRRHLPEAAWNRPKHGFSVPLSSYLRGPWRERCEAWLEGAEAVAPALDTNAIRNLWKKTLAGRGSLRLAYTFIALLAWQHKHRLTQ